LSSISKACWITPKAIKSTIQKADTTAGGIPGSSAWLVTLDPTLPNPALPTPLQWRSAVEWLLGSVEV
jgi:hypothetical protein